MKRADISLLLAGAVLLLAAAAYVLLFFTARAEAPVSAVCTAETWQETLALTGIAAREEALVPAPEGALALCADTARRTGGGDALAIAYDGGEAYFRAALLLRVRAEKTAADAAGNGAALRRLSLALARRDFAALGENLAQARCALGLPGTDAALLAREEASLVSAGAEDAIVYAPASGYLSGTADGAESFSPRSAQTLSASMLRALLEREYPSAPALRLTTGNGWAFAALVSAEDAERFSPGTSCELLLPDGTSLSAAVAARSGETQGAQAVIFSCSGKITQVLGARKYTLTALLNEQQGLAVPESALIETEDGVSVCRVSGPLREYAAVTVLARRGGRALVVSDGLRAGSTVLLAPPEDGERGDAA